jgi:hypothetical protein
MSGHDDFAFEPIPGLPAEPPKGETLLWQGRPATLPLAREAFKLNWILGYFAVIVAWRASAGFADAGLAGAFAFGLPYVILGALGVAVVMLLAWAQARGTIYTITSARVVMRIGAALNVTLNLPYPMIGSANLVLGAKGHGTIAMQTLGDTRLSYLVLWPHVRPWRLARAEPALRCIPDAVKVAGILADAAETRMAQPMVARAKPSAAPQAAFAAE